jgi:hypothetical protein
MEKRKLGKSGSGSIGDRTRMHRHGLRVRAACVQAENGGAL